MSDVGQVEERIVRLVPEHFRPEVIQLAEHLERLPPGNYTVQINKPDLKGLPWRAEIVRTERVSIVDLMR